MRPVIPRYRFERPRVSMGDDSCYIDPLNMTVRIGIMRHAADIVVLVKPDATENEVQVYVAHGFFESYLGAMGHFAPNCVPTWNWGACRPRDGQDSFRLGKNGLFAVFPSMEEGFRNYLRVIGKKAQVAARGGKALEFSTILAKAGYYGPSDSDAQGYAKALVSSARGVAKALGEPLLVSSEGLTETPSARHPETEPDTGSGPLALAAGAIFAGSIYLLSKAS